MSTGLADYFSSVRITTRRTRVEAKKKKWSISKRTWYLQTAIELRSTKVCEKEKCGRPGVQCGSSRKSVRKERIRLMSNFQLCDFCTTSFSFLRGRGGLSFLLIRQTCSFLLQLWWQPDFKARCGVRDLNRWLGPGDGRWLSRRPNRSFPT